MNPTKLDLSEDSKQPGFEDPNSDSEYLGKGIFVCAIGIVIVVISGVALVSWYLLHHS